MTRTSTVPVEPGGASAVIVAAELTENLVAATAPNFTELALLRLDPVMVTIAPPPARPLRGPILVTAGGGADWATAKLCCTCGAASYSPLPAWLASSVHVKVTVEPAMEHTELFGESIVKVTALPDAPPLAATL